tara:strand:- start:333 stop:761 length:429 start_codon:yes stop_codon:yes gene_type:complete
MKKLEQKKEKVIKYNKYQQGDVVMFQVDDETFAKYSTAQGSDNVIDYNTQSHNNPILAFGEVTGHLHQIHMKDMLDTAEVTLHMGRYREAGKDVPEAFEVREKTVTLTHEEHNPLDVPPGKYVVRIVREFDHMTGRSRYVAD